MESEYIEYGIGNLTIFRAFQELKKNWYIEYKEHNYIEYIFPILEDTS